MSIKLVKGKPNKWNLKVKENGTITEVVLNESDTSTFSIYQGKEKLLSDEPASINTANNSVEIFISAENTLKFKSKRLNAEDNFISVPSLVMMVHLIHNGEDMYIEINNIEVVNG